MLETLGQHSFSALGGDVTHYYFALTLVKLQSFPGKGSVKMKSLFSVGQGPAINAYKETEVLIYECANRNRCHKFVPKVTAFSHMQSYLHTSFFVCMGGAF